MALVSATLNAQLLSAFNSMNSMTEGGDVYLATQIGIALVSFVSSGQVTSMPMTDVGTLAPRAYTGTSTGTMTIQSPASQLQALFLSKATNDALADGIANIINSTCTAGIINVNTVGTLAPLPPSFPSPEPSSGIGIGTFSSSPNLISSPLKALFNSMNSMIQGGNEMFAQTLSNAINSYMISGTIAITLTTPIVGTGNGTIK